MTIDHPRFDVWKGDIPTSLPRRQILSVRPEQVRARPGRIEWHIEWHRGRGWHWLPGASASDCLFNFVRLADATSPEEFAHFAAVHGVLGIDEAGMPGVSTGKPPQLVPGDDTWFFERVSLWKAYAQGAKILLLLAEALRGDKQIDVSTVLQAAHIDENDLLTVDDIDREMHWLDAQADTRWHPGVPAPVPIDVFHALIDGAQSLQQQRKHLAFLVQMKWIGVAGIQPVIDWSGRLATLELRLSQTWNSQPGRGNFDWPMNSLFSVLAVELAGIICSDQFVAICSTCGRLLPSKRKVREDQPRYCEDCGLQKRRATNRNAGRKRYAREKAEQAARHDT